jgi:tRNA (adenine22-N1)-methyltransferase
VTALSPRLAALYELCLPKLPLWDLCCDHGYLGLWALHSGRHSEVIFNDAVPTILESLPQNFGQAAGRARLISGLAEDIQEPLIGSLCLAGIGAEKIFKILMTHAQRGTLQASTIAVCPEKDGVWLLAQKIPGFTLSHSREIPHRDARRWILSYSPTAGFRVS